MPVSKQQPLLAARGTHEHDFGQRYVDWEGAVFDRAEYFAVVEMRSVPARKYTKWKCFPWAIRYARRHPDACLYAVTRSGRFNNLEREKWPEWEIRWWGNKNGREASEESYSRSRAARAEQVASV
jgi:hypothetical protein